MDKVVFDRDNTHINVIGAGMAGSEAAYFLAESGFQVKLHEMRPSKNTAAHHTANFAELVCSNSFKSNDPNSAPGMLKAEMRAIGSLILTTAEKFSVPAGAALAVDRDLFSQAISQTLKSHPRIQVIEGEITEPSQNEVTLIATGPLTSDALCSWIARNALTADDLYFYDAIAPIVDAQSIDREASFLANRYGKGGEEAYINCPMSQDEYYAFVDAVLAGEKVAPKAFEKEKFFQGCQPIEAIAATGRDSLRFGPMKPVGLTDPRTGQRPYAVVQLRPENRALTAYNLVGFQTKLKYGEQSKVLRLIPALKNAEFLRMGSIHRNTYVCGPKVLRSDLSLKGKPQIYLAGQITGVEGYLESTACGLLAALFISRRLKGKPHEAPPANTALGALLRHVTAGDPDNYQPGNVHFGLFDPRLYTDLATSDKEKARQQIAEQSLQNFKLWWDNFNQISHGQSSKEIESQHSILG